MPDFETLLRFSTQSTGQYLRKYLRIDAREHRSEPPTTSASSATTSCTKVLPTVHERIVAQFSSRVVTPTGLRARHSMQGSFVSALPSSFGRIDATKAPGSAKYTNSFRYTSGIARMYQFYRTRPHRKYSRCNIHWGFNATERCYNFNLPFF